MIPRPEPSEHISRDGRTFSEIWLRVLYGVRDAVTGKLPPRVPVVTIGGGSVPLISRYSPSPPGQLIYVEDESGGAVLAYSDGSDWRRVTDRAVVS